jgi:hypothetical protein
MAKKKKYDFMGKVKVTRTFFPGELAKQCDQIITGAINGIGNRINDEIQNGIDLGTDINGKPFKKLKDVTMKRRRFYQQGDKILDITGKMKRTTIQPKNGISREGEIFKIIAETDYARTHNEGDSSRNIPKRQWFGFPKRFRPPRGPDWVKAIKLAKFQITRAFSGGGYKSEKIK